MPEILPSVYELYIVTVYNRERGLNKEVYLLYTAAIYNSYRKGTLSIRMEASLCCTQLLYTTHIERANSLSEWRSLSTVYSCTQLFYTTHIEMAHSLSEWRPSSYCMKLPYTTGSTQMDMAGLGVRVFSVRPRL